MPRFLLHFSLANVVLFAAALVIIRVQAYEDHDLRAVLLPDGCPAPCFMGIRPGVTTDDEAEQTLREHKWVEQVKVSEHVITWLWNGIQPEFLYNSESAARYGGVISISEKKVRSVTLSSQFFLGDLYLMLGQPEHIDSISVHFGDYVGMIIPYYASAFTAETLIMCPTRGGNYWRGTGNVAWSVTRTESTWSGQLPTG